MTDPPLAPPPIAGDGDASTPPAKRGRGRPPKRKHDDGSVEPPPETPDAANNTQNPDYPEMIITAIRVMEERGGSNKRTIGKFIEDNFSAQLPIDWDLLTHYLEAMKNSGHLLTANNSYYMLSAISDSLPRFDPPVAGDEDGSTSGVKRGRGRPRKDNPNDGSDGPSQSGLKGVFAQDGSTSGVKRGRGRPPKRKLEDWAKRGRGRPRKYNPHDELSRAIVPWMGLTDGGGHSVHQDGSASEVKRGRGRPRKPKHEGEDRVKRGRGRPRKHRSQAIVPWTHMPDGPSGPEVVGQSGLNMGRGRPWAWIPTRRPVGRPRKGAYPMSHIRTGRPVGRPRKGTYPPAWMRTGRPVDRPRKDAYPSSQIRTGRPVGRPRKYAYPWPSSNASTAATEQGGYEDLKNRFAYMQFRIKHTVDEVKPHVNNEGALRALQELKEFARTNASAPLNDQGEEPSAAQN